MTKKGDRYYFDNFIACVECSRRAATLLGETLKDYSKAFITPIEREDIVEAVIMKNS